MWAIDSEHLRNYLLPRDCPRVTYSAGPQTTAADVERFLGSSPAVVAVESGWFERIRSARLCCYQLPPETFELIDECAGYFVSRAAPLIAPLCLAAWLLAHSAPGAFTAIRQRISGDQNPGGGFRVVVSATGAVTKAMDVYGPPLVVERPIS